MNFAYTYLKIRPNIERMTKSQANNKLCAVNKVYNKSRVDNREQFKHMFLSHTCRDNE